MSCGGVQDVLLESVKQREQRFRRQVVSPYLFVQGREYVWSMERWIGNESSRQIGTESRQLRHTVSGFEPPFVRQVIGCTRKPV